MVVGKSDFKENPKSNLDLDMGFVNLTWTWGLSISRRREAQIAANDNFTELDISNKCNASEETETLLAFDD